MSILKFSKINIKRDIDSKYKAHLSQDEQTHEALKDHIDLVYEYFLKLVTQNNLENYLDNLFVKSTGLVAGDTKESDIYANFIKYLFAKTIYWHDMGKINPNFQIEKMKNREFAKINFSEESNHSPLGAYLFINHSFDELYSKNWNEDDIEIIESIIYLFGYCIAKHHGALYESNEIESKDDLKQFLKSFEISKDFVEIHKKEKRVFSCIYDYIEVNQEILFLLSKSLFSLLIISDYYATAQFMNYGNIKELKYNDFGLIDDSFRNKIYTEFYTDKFNSNKKQITFNQNLKDKTNSDFKNFEDLHEKSNENLNHLRNKLFVEVRTNLQNTLAKTPNQNLFYIEAPTGAGKTNLSLMSAVEILKNNTAINKVFYVFPFTTLITQTYEAIKTALNLDNSEIVQLHSRAKYNEKNTDGVYGKDKTNFLDNQFMNYPIALISHVKFFDILTGISKDDSYIFHRLANSVVIIDEMQTYNPKFWSQIAYLLDVFAKNFNIKFIVMSATLPKIGEIFTSKNFDYINLVSNKHEYFKNPNFAKRVEEIKEISENINENLHTRLINESKNYQKISTNGKAKTIIEFITKKGADKFYKYAKLNNKKMFDEIFILSGTILEARRKYIIDFLKNNDDKNILLVTTQVVEAGVDIDMDIGFKEKSLVDSDEQLAGRINRNSKKSGNKLFLFEMEKKNSNFVYKNDKRLDIQKKECLSLTKIEDKNFDVYYAPVIQKLKANNELSFIDNINTYIDHVKNLRFNEAHIKIIDMESVSVFVPIDKNAKNVWNQYVNAIQNTEQNLVDKKITIKKLSSQISQYTFSLAKYQGSGVNYLQSYCNEEYGYLYLKDWDIKIDNIKLYTVEDGLDTSVLSGDFVPMIF